MPGFTGTFQVPGRCHPCTVNAFENPREAERKLSSFWRSTRCTITVGAKCEVNYPWRVGTTLRYATRADLPHPRGAGSGTACDTGYAGIARVRWRVRWWFAHDGNPEHELVKKTLFAH